MTKKNVALTKNNTSEHSYLQRMLSGENASYMCKLHVCTKMATDFHIGQTDELKFFQKILPNSPVASIQTCLIFFPTFCMNLLSCRKDFDLLSNSWAKFIVDYNTIQFMGTFPRVSLKCILESSLSAILIADRKATQQFRKRSQEKCHVSGLRIYFGKNFVRVKRK